MSVAPHEETEPLLPGQGPVTSEHGLSRWAQLRVTAVKRFWSGQSTPILCCTFFLQFLISFAKHIVEVPIIRLFEVTACHTYYQQHDGAVGHRYGDDIEDRWCKVPAVQNELSTLTGWKFAFDAVYAYLSPVQQRPLLRIIPRPGLLLAIYYGSVAGKYGRKPVLLLFSTGMLLSLAWIMLVCWLDGRVPVRLIWLSSLFIFIGGGHRVAKAMLFTIVSDTVDASHRYGRHRNLFRWACLLYRC